MDNADRAALVQQDFESYQTIILVLVYIHELIFKNAFGPSDNCKSKNVFLAGAS